MHRFFSKQPITTIFQKIIISFLIVKLCANICIAQTHSIILGRPTDQSITASIVFDQNIQFYLEYGTQKNVYANTTTIYTTSENTAEELDLNDLTSDTRYFYRLRYRLIGATNFEASPEYNFHTQRAPGSSFRFLIEADEHLYDKKGIRNMYKVTLANQAKDSADFMLSLGDIFGDDHSPDETTSEDMDALHKDYLQYLGAVCHSMPFYVCLGNHEGENGFYLNQNPPENIAVYGTKWRKYYYPNPFPNNFYSGNTVAEDYGIGLPENYFAWTWGDALFVVLDVYRDCDVNEKPQKWDWTLGETQYFWLKNTLQNSNAKHKFVFAHHTRGQGRGGIKTASDFEWGGYDAGNYKFDIYRPGWGLPIHQLMVANGVDIFFQGHDHLYAKEELDGLIYQEVPMPSDSTYEIGVLANADAYTDITLPGTGHIRVNVDGDCVTVDFVRAWLPADTLSGEHTNGEVAYSYTTGKCTSSSSNLSKESGIKVFPNPADQKLFVKFHNPLSHETKIELINLQGQVILSRTVSSGAEESSLATDQLPSGIYILKTYQELQSDQQKVVIR